MFRIPVRRSNRASFLSFCFSSVGAANVHSDKTTKVSRDVSKIITPRRLLEQKYRKSLLVVERSLLLGVMKQHQLAKLRRRSTHWGKARPYHWQSAPGPVVTERDSRNAPR